MMAFGIILVFAGIILLAAGMAQAAQNRSFAACSQEVTGIITRKRKRNVKNGVAHELTVSYTVDGVPYEKVVGAIASEYEAMEEGGQIELKYDPNNPKKAVRPAQLNPKASSTVLMIGGGLAVAGVILFILGRM